MYNPVFKKIAIVGCPSSGKTTLANELGLLLNIPVHHLDKIFWVEKGGIKQEDFITQQELMMKGDTWIIDGNYMKSKSFDMRLSNADTIIFFKFSKIIILWRFFKRSMKWSKKLRSDLPENHKESFCGLFKFILKYPQKKELSRVMEYSKNKKVIILRNPKEERRFIKEIEHQAK